jgi:hypothetical protein
MQEPFEPTRFDLIESDEVHITDHQFGHNQRGELDVRIESSDRGKRFSSQIIVRGQPGPVRKEVYVIDCYILREKATGRYWFLDLNSAGFWLHNDSFFGAQNFAGAASRKIQAWLTQAVRLPV